MALFALDLSSLESHLWESANILRGPVDAADFKTYIFPMLFFKRISDVYDEEFEEALKESGGDRDYALFPENHRFQIPEGCHWNDVREKAANVGQAIQHAFREIDRELVLYFRVIEILATQDANRVFAVDDRESVPLTGRLCLTQYIPARRKVVEVIRTIRGGGARVQ